LHTKANRLINMTFTQKIIGGLFAILVLFTLGAGISTTQTNSLTTGYFLADPIWSNDTIWYTVQGDLVELSGIVEADSSIYPNTNIASYNFPTFLQPDRDKFPSGSFYDVSRNNVLPLFFNVQAPPRLGVNYSYHSRIHNKLQAGDLIYINITYFRESNTVVH